MGIREVRITLTSEYLLFVEFLKLNWNKITKAKVNYLLGFSACFVVVLSTSLFVTIIDNASVVLLRLSELEKGEIDLIISPGNWTHKNYLNFTTLDALSKNYKGDFGGISPRYKMEALATSSRINDTQYDAQLFLLDSKREKSMGLGRNWDFPPLPYDQNGVRCYLQTKLANTLDIKNGDSFNVTIDPLKYFFPFFQDRITSNQDPPNLINFTVTVQDTFSSPSGKFSNSISNAIVIEFEYFWEWIVHSLNNSNSGISQQDIMNISNINLYEFSQTISINLPEPRITRYLSSSFDQIQKSVTHFLTQTVYASGFDVISTELPVLSNLSTTVFFGLFLGLILNVIIFILLFLSIILLYSLLMISVETQTFEFGVLRMIGTRRRGIITILTIQSFSYSIPAWALGLIISQGLAVFITKQIGTLTGVTFSYLLTPRGVGIATALGILIPVVACILPIRKALTQNLSESLDTRHSKTKAVKIKINRSENTTISPVIVVVGVFLFAFGFGTYYLFPLALLSLNFTLLLNMFFFLLLGMILGLVLLSLNIEYFLEKIFIKGLLAWEATSIRNIVLKNLYAHRMRNRKTSIMYALSLGFIMFVSVSFTLNVQSFLYSIQQSNGVFLSVSAPNGFDKEGSPYHIKIKNSLEDFVLNSEVVESFSWISISLKYVNKNFTFIQITNVGHFYGDDQNIYAVPPNLFDTTIPGFLKIGRRMDKIPELPLAEAVYTTEGSHSLVIGATYRDSLGLKEDNDHLLLVKSVANTSLQFLALNYTFIDTRRMKPLAFVNVCPSFVFSRFPSVIGQDALVSFSSFVRLADDININSIEDIPLGRLLLKLKDDASKQETDFLITQLNRLLIEQKELSIFDYRQSVTPITTANQVMNYFFNFTTVVAMLISFFSLMSSMYTNIHEQKKEIGILRAMGVKKFWMIRIYIYEAFILVLASSILGLMIGLVVSFTMTLQRVLFTQLPIPFSFPYLLVIIVILFSMVFAILASCGPTRSVLKNPIVQILRD